MNITTNPYYSCITDPTNNYVDTITFNALKSEDQRIFQSTILSSALSTVMGLTSHILYGEDGAPAPISVYLLNDVEKRPKYYKHTRDELYTAYFNSFSIIENILKEFTQTHKFNELIYKHGVTLLNNKFYEDVNNRSFDFRLFVDGMIKMGNSLERYKDLYSLEK